MGAQRCHESAATGPLRATKGSWTCAGCLRCGHVGLCPRDPVLPVLPVLLFRRAARPPPVRVRADRWVRGAAAAGQSAGAGARDVRAAGRPRFRAAAADLRGPGAGREASGVPCEGGVPHRARVSRGPDRAGGPFADHGGEPGVQSGTHGGGESGLPVRGGDQQLPRVPGRVDGPEDRRAGGRSWAPPPPRTSGRARRSASSPRCSWHTKWSISACVYCSSWAVR